MTYTISKGLSKQKIAEILSRIGGGGKSNFLKLSGRLDLKIDPLDFQKQLRDEWE